jgi:transcriptional regulator with XRE-family HTH domain
VIAFRVSLVISTKTNPALQNPLRRWRVDQGLTQQELADLVGLSESMISRLESGERQLSLMAKARFARRLNCRIADVFPPDPLDDEEVANG